LGTFSGWSQNRATTDWSLMIPCCCPSCHPWCGGAIGRRFVRGRVALFTAMPLMPLVRLRTAGRLSGRWRMVWC
jgi:hypothetical protein